MLRRAVLAYRVELILLVLLLVTMVFSFFPAAVEAIYSGGIYQAISPLLRVIFGYIPFSVGDILYGLAFFYLLLAAARFVYRLRRNKGNRQWWLNGLRKILRVGLAVYLVFQWFWGLNYHRLGSTYQLHLQPAEYTEAELVRLTDTLNNRLVSLIPVLQPKDSLEWSQFKSVEAGAIRDYASASSKYPFLRYRVASVKRMMVGNLGGYGGFSGYLNPFTGEAQLNSNMPPFLRSYVVCHEIGHQIGYAAEEEANLAGYLVAHESKNPAVRYSVYHDLLTYAARELYHLDSNAFHNLMAKVPALVKQHSRQARDYYDSFQNPIQPYINQWYDLYLKANDQEKGLRSYSFITAWLIAYANKFGWDKV